MDEADHPARRGDGQRQVGQPAGDPRRRLPAGPGVARSPRRSAPRSPGCWLARSAGCARARSRSCATPTTRRGPRRATSRRSAARRPRCSPRRRASAGSSPASTGPTIDALTEYGEAYGMVFQIVDDLLDITVHRGRSSASPPATTWSKACTPCRCCARCRPAASPAAELLDAAGQAARRRRAGEGARDRPGQRRRRRSQGDGDRVGRPGRRPPRRPPRRPGDGGDARRPRRPPARRP